MLYILFSHVLAAYAGFLWKIEDVEDEDGKHEIRVLFSFLFLGVILSSESHIHYLILTVCI